jgi:hypothetical protein
MSRTDDIQARLDKLLGHLAPSTGRWLNDMGDELLPGQVWTVAEGCGDHPTWLWLLLDVPDAVADAAPLFRWGELSGPEDLYVPEALAGAPLIVSFELEATVDRSALGECQGRLPAEGVAYVLQARADLQTARHHAHNWGMEYIDQLDRRLAYHEGIAATIERLQSSVRDMVFGMEESEGASQAQIIEFAKTIPFSSLAPAFQDVATAAAADSGDGNTYSPCIVLPLPFHGGVEGVESVDRAKPATRAKCESFEPLVPCSEDPICCEWTVEMECEHAVGALVYATGVEFPIGNATVYAEDGGVLVVLDRSELPEGADVVHRPEMLRLVILEDR